MSKYIDAEKLIERLEEMKRAEYENCGGVNSKTGALQEVQELIASLQQEQAEVELERDAVQFCFDKGLNVTPYQAKTIAHHFYELGLNARKEE